MSSAVLPDFLIIESALGRVNAEISGAELHGAVSGLICAFPQITPEDCFGLVFGEENISHKQEESFVGLFNYTWQSLQQMDFEYNLLLPDDDEPLGARIEALADWCHGFVTILQMSPEEHKSTWSEDVKSVIDNIQDVTFIDTESTEDSNDDEVAYVELVEYVRLGILMIYADMIEAKVNLTPSTHDQDELLH